MSPTIHQEIQKRSKLALRLVRKIGRVLKKSFYGGSIETFVKEGNETVTQYDLRVDEYLKNKLLKAFPDSWISEESIPVQGSSGFTWVLDPVDGTNNFSLKIPFYCISLALKYRQKTVAGIIYDPVHEISYFTQGQKSYIAHKKSLSEAVVSQKPLEESLVGFGFHPDFINHCAEIETEWNSIQEQAKASRRFGAAALEIAYVGIGKLSLYWIMGAREWDIAAGLLFAERAGAKVILNEPKKYVVVYQPSVEIKIQKLIKALENHH